MSKRKLRGGLHQRGQNPALYAGYLWELPSKDKSLPPSAPQTRAPVHADPPESSPCLPSVAESDVCNAPQKSHPLQDHESSPQARLEEAFAGLESVYGIWRRKPYCCRFYPYAGLSSTIRERREDVSIRVSDLLCDAPKTVLQGILDILLAKFWKRNPNATLVAAYEEFVSCPDFDRERRRIHRERGRGKQLTGTAGRVRDLKPQFDQLNRDYFNGKLRAPISWSVKRMKTMLGYYDTEHNTIIINKALDSRSVPLYVLNYILYHEMLHVEQDYSPRRRGKRRNVHDKGFQFKERLFVDYGRAIRWLTFRGWI